ncbi:MAG: hypothetical protein Fues2KO_15700 [Fuerstiella sp.]
MDERNQEFRVGLMAVAALAATVVMVFRFGDIGNQWRSGTRISVIMSDASGIYPQTPVQMSGIQIGRVEQTELIAEGRGVRVDVVIDSEFTFRDDSTAQASKSLLGDAALQILPGKNGRPIQEGDRIAGRVDADPMAAVARVEQRLESTLSSFENTGREWGRLANNLNRLLEASGPDGVSTMQRSAVALEQFTRTMKTAEETLSAAGSLIGDPQYQAQLQQTLVALPQLLNETRNTLSAVNSVVNQVDTTVGNLNEITTPLAANGQTMAARLDASLSNIEAITGELAVVAKLMNDNDGTVRRLLTDPAMYRNLNTTSASLAVLLENLKPVVADLRVFSDKVARHPELLGVRGVVRGSDGVKETNVRQTGFEQR